MAAATWAGTVDTVDEREAEEDDSGAHAVTRRPVPFTMHARRRGARRNVAPDAVEYVLAHGRTIQRTGVTFYFLGRRDLPAADRSEGWASRLEGTILVMGEDGAVITVYRNRRGLRTIKRKLKCRLPQMKRPHEADPVERDEARWATA